MYRDSLRKTPSLNSQNSLQKGEQTVVMVSGAKIHRANILARIIHSLSLNKMDWGLHRVKNIAANRKIRHKKLGLAINRIFRRAFHQQKFTAMQKLKQKLLQAQEHEIVHSQKIIQIMSKASKSIIFLVLKAKRREIIGHAFENIKRFSIQRNSKKRKNQRKSIRMILQFLVKDKRYAFQKLLTSRLIGERKQKIKHLVYTISNFRKSFTGWSFWKLRRNLLQKRREQVQSDIKAFEQKINNINDPQLQAIREKKEKLEEHLNKVQQQKTALEEQFNLQFKELENKRQELDLEITNLQQRKAQIQSQITETQNQVNSPYSLDQIYQCVYHNFLLYINETKQKVYNRQQILNSLTYPLIPIDVPISVIKEQNKVMQELLNEYIIMFGHKKLETEVQLPYQFLVKENQVMYKMLLTLLPEIETDRDDLRIIRDNLFKLSAKVGQIWGK